MKTLVVLLVVSFVVGGTRLGRWLPRHPLVLLAASAVAAAAYYSLRIVT